MQFALLGEMRSITEPRSGSDRVSSGTNTLMKNLVFLRLSVIAKTRSLPLLGSVAERRRHLTVKLHQHLKLVRLVCLLFFLVSLGVSEADAQKLDRVFGNTKGAFVLYDLKNNR